MLAVFQNVGKFGVAAAVASGFYKTDFDIVIALPVQFRRGKSYCNLKFSRGSGVVFCILAYNAGKVAFYSGKNHFAPSLQYTFSYRIKVTSQAGDFRQKFFWHFDINLCQRKHHSFWRGLPDTSPGL